MWRKNTVFKYVQWFDNQTQNNQNNSSDQLNFNQLVIQSLMNHNEYIKQQALQIIILQVQGGAE